MKIFPAIDIKDGKCVRLFKGDFSTVHKVAESPIETAKSFEKCGAEWIHMVDLDGAKDGKRINSQVFIDVRKSVNIKIELGGGIRDMDTVDYYLQNGIDRVILGSAAVKRPDFVREAVEKYGEKIAVGIDAKDGMVMAEGWLDASQVYFTELAVQMEKIGVKTIIFTDISKDGMLSGPNFNQLKELKNAVSCNITASGGISCIDDIVALRELGVYGAICGKSIYSGMLDLKEAIARSRTVPDNEFIESFFKKGELIPTIIQEYGTKEVLMLAYMNRESLKKTYETGYTWFYSRSRQELWNKGATSGHLQRVIEMYTDCDDDTLLIIVEQTGAACHTGNHSCFYTKID